MELAEKKSHRLTNYDPDNPDQEMIHQCIKYARRHLNPIIDWTTDEVWEFLHKYNVPYCCLYDQGFKRLGCIGCPMGTPKAREEEFRRWPTYKQAYIHAFDRMIEKRKENGMVQFAQGGYRDSRNGSTGSVVEMVDGSNRSEPAEERLIEAEYDICDKKIVAVPKWKNGEDVMKWWIK